MVPCRVPEEIYLEFYEPQGNELPYHPEGRPFRAVADRVVELGVAHPFLALSYGRQGGR